MGGSILLRVLLSSLCRFFFCDGMVWIDGMGGIDGVDNGGRGVWKVILGFLGGSVFLKCFGVILNCFSLLG